MAYTVDLLESFDANDWSPRSNLNGSVATSASGARTGANGLRCTGGGFNGRINWLYPAATVFPGAGFWAWNNNNGSFTGVFAAFKEGIDGTAQITLNWNGDDLEVKRASTVLGSAAGLRPPLNSGVYVVWWAEINNTTGKVKVWVDGTLVIDVSSVDTQNTGNADVRTFEIGNGAEIITDDIIMARADSSTDFFNMEVTVETRLPDGNGNYSQLTGSDGNSTDNYLLVDETTPSMTDYVGSDVAGNKDSYTMQDLVAAAGSVIAFQHSFFALKSQAGAKSARGLYRRAGVDAVSADRVLSTSATTYDVMHQLDPTDSSALTIAKVNALEVGGEVRA